MPIATTGVVPTATRAVQLLKKTRRAKLEPTFRRKLSIDANIALHELSLRKGT